MKHTLRPVYTVLLPLFLVGTLAMRVAFHGYRSFQLNYEEPTSQIHQKPIFNKTFLEYAAIDIDESRLKQEIEDLLDGKYSSRGQKRTFLNVGNHHVYVRDKSIKGFMLRSPEFSRLWLSFRRYLGDWSRKRKFHPDVMSVLADEVKVLIDEYNGKKGITRKYRSCAVVGNSGVLLNHNDGKLIDSHEVVIRLNNARTRSFESNVGSKTSISFVNSNILHLCARRPSCFCHPYGENVPIIMYICQPVHFFDYLACNSSHRAPLLITDPRFDVLCARIVKYYSFRRFVELAGKGPGEWSAAHDDANFHYSSGMQAVMLAVGVCEEVSIFGFGKSNLTRHHYHTNQKAELSLHDYEAEYDFYRDLIHRPQSIPFISNKFRFPPVVMH